MNGVVPSGYAYSARQHPPRDWLTKFAFPPEGYRTPRVGQLEQKQGIMNPVNALRSAHISLIHASRDLLTTFSVPPEGTGNPRVGQLEQNRAS